MTFFNLAMLGGAAALAIPLVIHLLSRSRFQVVPWGACICLSRWSASIAAR